MHLAIACFNAESLAVALANLDRCATNTPGGKPKFLTAPLAVLTIAVTAIADADRHRHFVASLRHCVPVPTGSLPFEPPQAGRRPLLPLLRLASAKHHGHQEGHIAFLQELDNREGEEHPVEQQTPGFQA